MPGDSPGGGGGCELRGVKPAGVTGSLTAWSLRMQVTREVGPGKR